MQGNSLIEEFHGISLDIEKKNEQKDLFEGGSDLDALIDDLHQKQDDFFNAEHPREKKKKRDAVENAIYNIFNSELKKKENISPQESKPIKTELIEMTHGNQARNFFPWKLYFADVFREKGGFDVVTGNPPYIGEKGNKDLFTKIRGTKRGKNFYQRRMDLFYFFFHSGIDYTNENGFISFITTNYFLTATSGTKLRRDIKERTSIISFINFNELKIFESALGQHNMITRLKKGHDPDYLSNNLITSVTGNANNNLLNNVLNGLDLNTEYFQIKNKRMFISDENYIIIGERKIDNVLNKMLDYSYQLGEICNINQGIVSGADKVSKKHIERFDIQGNKGDGIFVLNIDELKLKGINLKSPHVKPWFKNSNINRYWTPTKPIEYVLYFKDLKVKQEIAKPILDHFEPFKELLIARLSVCKNNKFQWNIVRKWIDRGEYYLLFYPRKQNMFEDNKIVVPQRSKINTFGYNEGPWYASADVYFIRIKENMVDYHIKFILCLLNSKLFYKWLYFRGKRKGYTLELYQKPLSEIPIRKSNIDEQKSFIRLADQILISKKTDPYSDTTALEAEIDQLVYELYGLTDEEIAIVEESTQ